MKSPKLIALVVAVDVAALGALAALPRAGLLDRGATLAMLLLLAATVGTRSVRIPYLRMSVTAADLFVFCALATLAPVAAPLMALSL